MNHIKATRKENIMEYQGLIAIDLDGTLLQDFNTIADKDREALKTARDQGYLIAISTGRSGYVIKRRLAFWQLEDIVDIVSGSNGAELFDLKVSDQAEILGGINRAAVEEALGLVANEDFGFAWYSEHEVHTNPENPHMEALKEQMGLPIVLVPKKDLAKAFPEYWTKGVFFLRSKDDQYLQQMIEKDRKENYRMVLSDEIILEMISPDIDKGTIIKEICKRKNIAREDSMAIGDMANDKEMLMESGFGVAMGNAIDELKEVADYVTADVKDNGVAQAVYKFISREKQ